MPSARCGSASGQSFLTIVRPVEHLPPAPGLGSVPALSSPPGAKRIVTFFRAEPETAVALPLERRGARLLVLEGRALFTAYVPRPKGGAPFMALIERTFGTEITTRTWDTVVKVARA